MKSRIMFIVISVMLMVPFANVQAQEEDELQEWNNQIRREKFDLVLPIAMKKHNVDMWIHVMRTAIPDPFGAEDLGSTSGVFVFTDRGGDRIERAILGRRWGATQRGWGERETLVEESGAYDIIHDPVFVQEPVTNPMTEHDYRFKGLREFVEERDPKRIAVNFIQDLGQWVTYVGMKDGISHADYLLLTEELGEKYASRMVSSEYVEIDYIRRTVPSEIELLKKMRQDELERVKKAFDAIVPGVTRNRDVGITLLSRRSTGISQRGSNPGYENSVIRGGDIVASPSQGMYAYVLRVGETELPPEIKKIWAEYLKIDKILVETIKAGLTPRAIMKNYMPKFEEAGIIVRKPQMHMVQPKNNFPVYSIGFDPEKTQLTIDCHAYGKGARWSGNEQGKFSRSNSGTRIGSQGPDWTKDTPLPPNHHLVVEYFFYMPSPTPNENEDQYIYWWGHEQAIATESGVEYLSPPQKELILIN